MDNRCLKSDFVLGEIVVVLLQLGHVVQRVLGGDAELGQVFVLAFDPYLPHLHIAEGFVRESQIEFVHFWGKGSGLSTVGVA